VEYSYSQGNCSYTVTGATNGPFDPYTGSGVEAELRIYLDVWVLQYQPNMRRITYVRQENCSGASRTSQVALSIPVPPASPDFKYPDRGLILDNRATAQALGVLIFDPPPQVHLLTWNVHYHVEPVTDELRLEITSSKYDTWRPSAEPGPQSCVGCASGAPKPGESIEFTAAVKRASGQPAQVQVDRFVWELTGTSREPGIALNSPPILTDEYMGPDLKLDTQPGQLATGSDGQKVERSSPASPEDRAVVLPYDWGGWSTLQVTAYLKDGRKLVGKYQGSQEEGVRLPKRADSFIADAWKNQTGASGADQDDKETDPAGEDGCDGDGLTLYEEYRGFYENGKHIEGNPKRKDLFIFNKCGAVAEPGITLFQSLTGLQVHKDLREDERNYSIDGDYTAINGHFDKGPHRVVQHRVEITWCGTSRGGGGGTKALNVTFSDSHHMRPKDVENVYVERPDSRYWTQQYGVSTDDQPRQFDVALAHELLHTVGVDHHGEGDNTVRFQAFAAGATPNPTGHAAWLFWNTDIVVTLLDEATGTDIGESSASRALRTADLAAQLKDVPPAVQALMEGPDWLVQNYQIGVENGESSGDENCVMRYWLSDAYPKKGTERTLYLVPPGTEPVGTQICTSPAGKTINADRKPQPRYFNAAETRGSCKFWVCVNDAIPPKSSEIPKKKVQ